MTMSYRIPGIFAVDPTTRIRHGMLFSAKLIFWPLALLTRWRWRFSWAPGKKNSRLQDRSQRRRIRQGIHLFWQSRKKAVLRGGGSRL